MNLLPTSIGIMGSCVSDDIIPYVKTNKLMKKKPMRDVTIFGLDTPRPTIDVGDIIHNSSLHTMWIKTLWDGKVFEYLRENAGEYLIIDLVDERFGLVKIQDSIFNEHFFSETNIIHDISQNLAETERIEFFDQNTFSEAEITYKFDLFCRKIMDIYDPRKIIIIEFYLIDKYMDNDVMHDFSGEVQRKMIAKSSKCFGKWYQLLEKGLPGSKVIRFSKSYLADKNHPRGLSPCHPTFDYYEDTYNRIIEMIEEDYKEQRKISCSVGQLPQRSDKYTQMITELGGAYVAKLFGNIMAMTDLQHKTVLWVGDRIIHRNIVRNLKIKKFVQILDLQKYPNSKKTDMNMLDFDEMYQKPQLVLEENNFAYYSGDINDVKIDFCNYFDVVFIDNIETIKSIPLMVENAYKMLNKDGVFVARTGRTWSCSSGSKWQIDCNHSYLNENPLVLFQHLLCSYQELYNLINRIVSDEMLCQELALKMKNGSVELNRLYYEDYKSILNNSLFAEKRMIPMYKENIDREVIKQLLDKNPGYTEDNYIYKSLFMYAKK